jgi:predicted nuclease of predicted toxin-antitoxin system
MSNPSEGAAHLFIQLYLDEDVFKGLAQALRLRGYNAVSVHAIGRQGISDSEHLDRATAEGKALFTFNAPDFLALHIEYVAQGKSHSGIIASKQIPIGEAVRRLSRLLNTVTAEEMHNQFWWLAP